MNSKKALFSADLTSLEALLDFVCDFVREKQWSQKECNQVRLLVEEAVVNIISYAYEKREGGIVPKIALSCRWNKEKELTIGIKDWGKAFNPLAHLSPKKADLSLEQRSPGGWGISLIKTFSDALRYRRTKHCNLLTIKKRQRDCSS